MLPWLLSIPAEKVVCILSQSSTLQERPLCRAARIVWVCASECTRLYNTELTFDVQSSNNLSHCCRPDKKSLCVHARFEESCRLFWRWGTTRTGAVCVLSDRCTELVRLCVPRHRRTRTVISRALLALGVHADVTACALSCRLLPSQPSEEVGKCQDVVCQITWY